VVLIWLGFLALSGTGSHRSQLSKSWDFEGRNDEVALTVIKTAVWSDLATRVSSLGGLQQNPKIACVEIKKASTLTIDLVPHKGAYKT